ncbi:Fe-S metabolism protein SufE [Bacteroidia bacterium]|nr:Fe-S metabolism protein SufE [Bacteroidia bacterium]
MTIKEKEQEIIDAFGILEDWIDKYAYLIELGNELSPMDEAYKTNENLITGCQSNVWLHTEFRDGLVYFTAESDAIITKGIIALLIRVFSEEKPEDILKADIEFIDTLGLKQHLSPTRSNGLLSMLKQIKMYALAYQEKFLNS